MALWGQGILIYQIDQTLIKSEKHGICPKQSYPEKGRVFYFDHEIHLQI